MRGIKVLMIAALALLPVPTSAAAAPVPAAPAEPSVTAADHQRPGACRRAWTRIWTSAPIYSEPRTNSTLIGRSTGGTYACRHLQVGGRYNLCGATNSGWVLVPVDAYPRQGWVPNQCTEDPTFTATPVSRAPVWPAENSNPFHETPGACRHAWMQVLTGELAVRSEPRANAPEISRITSRRIYPCRHMQAGGLYRDVCGADNTGWILIPLLPYPAQGWIPSQCTADPIL